MKAVEKIDSFFCGYRRMGTNGIDEERGDSEFREFKEFREFREALSTFIHKAQPLILSLNSLFSLSSLFSLFFPVYTLQSAHQFITRNLFVAGPSILQYRNNYNYGHDTQNRNSLAYATGKKNKHDVDNEECYGVNNTHALYVILARLEDMFFHYKVGLTQKKHQAK